MSYNEARYRYNHHERIMDSSIYRNKVHTLAIQEIYCSTDVTPIGLQLCDYIELQWDI